MDHINALQWAVLGLAAFMIGISKTGVPGIGILAIPLVALVWPARASTGLILPMLILGDVFAVAYYRRHAEWSHLVRLLPWTVAGVVLGYLALGRVTDRQLRPAIGGVILAMLAVNLWRTWSARQREPEVPSHWSFGAAMGVLAGTTTMMANAAGPIMAIYLLAMRLPKTAFIGTGAWYFFVLNTFKVPFSAHLGLITSASIRVNLMLAPAVVVGAFLGVLVLKRIPEKAFGWVVQALAAAAALKLLF